MYIAQVLSESIKSKVIWELPSTMKLLMSGYSWYYLLKPGQDWIARFKFRLKNNNTITKLFWPVDMKIHPRLLLGGMIGLLFSVFSSQDTLGLNGAQVIEYFTGWCLRLEADSFHTVCFYLTLLLALSYSSRGQALTFLYWCTMHRDPQDLTAAKVPGHWEL